jgi:hypothetical protein
MLAGPHQAHRIHYRLSAGMIGGHDERRGGVGAQPFDPLLPSSQLLRCVKIIRGDLLPSPIVAVAAEQTNVAERRSDDRLRRHRACASRLIQVAEAYAIIHQGPQRFIERPTGVSHFRNQREFVESPAQLDQEIPIFPGEPARPRETHQQAPQFSRVSQGPQTLFERPDRSWVELALVAELLPQDRHKLKAGALGHHSHPQLRELGPQRPFK